MKACDLFIRLLSLLALVIGVCSMVDYDRQVFTHVWTSQSPGSRRQTFGGAQVDTAVSVRHNPSRQEPLAIFVNNPLEVPVMVRVKVIGIDGNPFPNSITDHFIRPNPRPWRETRVRALDELPLSVEVQYLITGAEYERLLGAGPSIQRQESIALPSDEVPHSEPGSPSHE
ncbi:hypothetical protein PTTG_28327 [Puccinia triticina 1-1 BBBD Race 1]|uniref:Uncharacterized protein n=2 Tax=Puccinia triticina TaxID=208348 RepID=A0A180GCV5_PUCT1|nr:uncharacterized protein PtA15_5A771 [Puccinia triticina]OAV90451.1 hypothetical protein PTTG_28327 [Puccinia triticina 1-1 BBBD Race 1]WAQ85197.1 hypothetical protein PtA15_5A771 [Puccinia triticina]WAR58530.1 hypothetical protein PtB15_5B764 [Puccinia triticina]